jgi:molecular chaperone GrpE (heat shock protein)
MKSDMNSAERQPCGEERELPEASVESAQANGPAAVANLEPDALLENVTAERDALLDRVARIQAEFENFRKRNA